MKFWQSSHVFQHPWSTVTQAFWRKYPNDFQTSVYGTDVIERYVDSEGKLHSKRIIMSDWNIPSFMKFFFGEARGYAVEYSIVDPVEQTLTLRSQNINAVSMFAMREEIAYKGVGETTQLDHTARFVFSVSRIVDDAAENWLVGTITEAARKGLMAMESITVKVEDEMQCALSAIDDISTETMRSVDCFATDALSAIDDIISTETMRSVEKSIDSSITDAEKFIDSSIEYIDSSVDSLTQESGVKFS